MTVESAIQDYLSLCPPDEELSTLSLRQSLSGGQNTRFLATTRSGVWFAKFCRNNYQRVPEVCEREALVSLLGRIVGVSVVNAWVVSTSLLSIAPPNQNPEGDLIRDRLVLMNAVNGSTMQQNQEKASQWVKCNGTKVADILAFIHWIGDEDRSLSDVMLDSTGLVLIDNGLCGPGRSDKLRGYHPTPEVYSPDRILLKCYGGGKLSFVEFVLKCREIDEAKLGSPAIIPTISALSLDDLRRVVECVNVDGNIAQVLHDRGQTLSNDYAKWFDEAASYCRPSSNS